MAMSRDKLITGILIGVLVVLIICLVCCLWRDAKSKSKFSSEKTPKLDCSNYSGNLQDMCQTAQATCKKLGVPGGACEAAAATCLNATKASQNHVNDLNSGAATPVQAFNGMAEQALPCIKAMLALNPEKTAEALRNVLPASIPPQASDILENAQVRQNVQNLSNLVPAVTKWGLSFGQTLAANGTFPSKETFGMQSHDCYSDIGCHPNGRCMADFADYPPYGGKCVPS